MNLFDDTGQPPPQRVSSGVHENSGDALKKVTKVARELYHGMVRARRRFTTFEVDAWFGGTEKQLNALWRAGLVDRRVVQREYTWRAKADGLEREGDKS